MWLCHLYQDASMYAFISLSRKYIMFCWNYVFLNLIEIFEFHSHIYIHMGGNNPFFKNCSVIHDDYNKQKNYKNGLFRPIYIKGIGYLWVLFYN